MTTAKKEITDLLIAWKQGDNSALDKLTPLVYDELHRLAHFYMNKEQNNNLLQTTALINELYCQLMESEQVDWQNRNHFFGLSAHIMRRILVGQARNNLALKRGAGKLVSFDEALYITTQPSDHMIALDDALNALAKIDKRAVKIVELRYFAGLSIEETAEFLRISPATIKRDWDMAKGWLYQELNNEGQSHDA